MSDVERICTDVAFLNDGQIIVQGKMDEIKEKNKSKDILLEFDNEMDAKKILEGFSECSLIEGTKLVFRGTDERIFELLKYIAENKINVNKVERMERTLEALFLEEVSK